MSKTLAICALTLLAWAGNATAASVAVVASGLGGNSDYAESFAADAAVITAALQSLDPAGEAQTTLPPASDRQSILDAIESQVTIAADTFVLVLIGHGTADARGWKFNVPGEDLTGDDLVAALAGVSATRQLVIVASSASGALLDTLAQPGRVLVTATKSAGEINAVRFPRYLAEALESDVADLDRNEILTIAEAFRYADARTREHYDNENLLASEHARLIGDEASSLAVARLGSLRLAGDDPDVAVLLEERLALERDYLALLASKADKAVDAYYDEFESLMLSIAKLQQAIDRASGWSDEDV